MTRPAWQTRGAAGTLGTLQAQVTGNTGGGKRAKTAVASAVQAPGPADSSADPVAGSGTANHDAMVVYNETARQGTCSENIEALVPVTPMQRLAG